MRTKRNDHTLRNRLAQASAVLALGSATPVDAVPVIATFDLTSPTVVNYTQLGGNYPPTFTADTGITVTAGAWYNGANVDWKNSVSTDPNGAGVMGDQYIVVDDFQRLVLYGWSVPGRLVGFTIHEDGVRNQNGSGVRLFGGVSGTTQIDVWNVANGQDLVVDLSGYSGLDQTALLNFATTVDVDSSFQVKELRWEYDRTQPVPESGHTLALLGLSLAGLGVAKRQGKRG